MVIDIAVAATIPIFPEDSFDIDDNLEILEGLPLPRLGVKRSETVPIV
jgi:hypothetical protein